ncbi:MAG: TIGR02117 family protein [Microcoleus sp.]|uniref:TIGR02117 family protein n=1 Tax=Microcoleus sp. TaxID=44472 RepID=UPI003C722B63
MRKIIKRLGIVILSFTAVLTIGYLTPRKWGNYSQADCTISLYISNEGIHTEIIVPVKNQYFDWNQFLPLTEIGRDTTSDFKYLSFGWGDRAFMLENPSSGSINLVTGLKALILPTPSTVQVQGYRGLPENTETKCVAISGSNYLKMVDYLKNTFQLDAKGNKIKIGYGYGNSSSFYEARDSYYILKTCNDWTAEGLQKAEVNTPLWSTLPSSIMFHLNSGCECRSH